MSQDSKREQQPQAEDQVEQDLPADEAEIKTKEKGEIVIETQNDESAADRNQEKAVEVEHPSGQKEQPTLTKKGRRRRKYQKQTQKVVEDSDSEGYFDDDENAEGSFDEMGEAQTN